MLGWTDGPCSEVIYKSDQQIIHVILQSAKNTKTHGITIRLQWIPGYCEIAGNDTADWLAKEASVPAH
jgi:hypothetical protein